MVPDRIEGGPQGLYEFGRRAQIGIADAEIEDLAPRPDILGLMPVYLDEIDTGVVFSACRTASDVDPALSRPIYSWL